MKNHTKFSETTGEAARCITLSGDGISNEETCHIIRLHGVGNVELQMKDYSDWTQVEGFLESGRRLTLLPKGDPVPYDKVEIEFNRARRHWIIGKCTKTGQAFIHCLMPFGHGILLSL